MENERGQWLTLATTGPNFTGYVTATLPNGTTENWYRPLNVSTNLFIITFTVTPVYVERKSEDPYSVIDLDTGGISVSGIGGEINSIEKSSPSQWIVHVNKSGLTLHIAENTFRNKYGNGNESI